jgi:hypothetical protein
VTSIGTGYEAVMATFAERWQAGEVSDLVGGLRDVDREINILLRRPTTTDGSPADDLAIEWRGSPTGSRELRAAFLS